MGQCASPAPKRKPTHFHDREPVDTESLRERQLPKLYFHAVLANVKLKKYPHKVASAVFKVREGESFTLASKQTNAEDSIVWKIYEKFGFQMTEYQLRKQFLDVTVMGDGGQKVASVRINLFLITTGPSQQDFALQFASGKVGRISFDLKISQIIELRVQSEFAQIDLIRKHPGEEFSFSFKTIAGYNGASSESPSSYPAVILLDKRVPEVSRQVEEDRPEMTLVKKKSQKVSTKQIAEGGNLAWTRDGGELPSLSTKVIASELHNTYFQVLIWREGSEETARELFADCYVSFYKLFGAQAKLIGEGVAQREERSITMSQKIQHYGKEYGRGRFQFRITNQPYFKQYQVCVHTEVGILKTQPLFGVQQTSSSQNCPELQQILSISAEVELNIIELNKLQAEEGSRSQVKQVKQEIEIALQKMFKLLERSSHPPAVLYKYSSQKQLLKGQKILVELGMKIAGYFQIEDPVINDICWLILISLIKRGEFSLSHMGFNDKQKKLIIKNNLDSHLKEKETVAVMYKLLLYKLLALALNSLDHKGSQYQKTFAQIFSAFAYFRIPEFRKEILRLITKESDPQIIEWRGVEFSLTEDISQGTVRDSANTFSEMFDWQNHFYKCLLRHEQLQNENLSLSDILAQDAWKERFIKRGLAFFYFIKYWVTYVESALPAGRQVQWRYFPGYNRLLRGFFVEMKLRNILQYPDALMEAGLKLLSNEKLLNPLIKILLNKVNVFDTSAVMRFLEYLNLLFKPFANKRATLPISFNYTYFFKGIRIILDSDFSLAVTSALTLLYAHFPLFHLEFQRSLSMYLLGKAFFRLFLNWSHSVREIFYHLITYRVYKEANSISQHGKLGRFSIEDSDILTRYDDLMGLLQKHESEYQKEKIAFLNTNLQKNMHQRMKIKAYQRFKKIRYEKDELHNYTKADSENKNFHQMKTQTKFILHSHKMLTIRQERHSSQVLAEKVRLPNGESNIGTAKKEQIKRLSKTNEFAFDHLEEADHHSILFQNIIPEKQFMLEDMDPKYRRYLETCLPRFRQVQALFIKSLQAEDKNCPVLKHELSIDQREIRPDKIDDW